MPRNVYEGYCNLIDHFPVGSTLSVAEVQKLVNCSEQTASRIVQCIPGKYVERTIQKDRDGRKRRYITLVKPFTALDLKLWVIRHQSEEKIDRDTRKTKVAANNRPGNIVSPKDESSVPHKDQTDLILQLQQELEGSKPA